MRVAAATDPADGYDHTRELDPNLVITDLRFAGQEASGVSLVDALRQDRVTADVPILLLTEGGIFTRV